MVHWRGNGKPLQYLCLIYINKVVKILEKKKEVRGNSGNSERLIWGAPKSLQMVTAAMKLKDAYSLKEKL